MKAKPPEALALVESKRSDVQISMKFKLPERSSSEIEVSEGVDVMSPKFLEAWIS